MIKSETYFVYMIGYINHLHGGHRGHDRMGVGFTTTCAISDYHYYVLSSNSAHEEVYSIQQYVIKFVSDLRHAGCSLRVFWFPRRIKLTTTI